MRRASPVLRVTPNRRCYVLGYRLHHGLFGAILAAFGAVLTYHDRRDFPWRLRDR